jgi:hypothetical protein
LCHPELEGQFLGSGENPGQRAILSYISGYCSLPRIFLTTCSIEVVDIHAIQEKQSDLTCRCDAGEYAAFHPSIDIVEQRFGANHLQRIAGNGLAVADIAHPYRDHVLYRGGEIDVDILTRVLDTDIDLVPLHHYPPVGE